MPTLSQGWYMAKRLSQTSGAMHYFPLVTLRFICTDAKGQRMHTGQSFSLYVRIIGILFSIFRLENDYNYQTPLSPAKDDNSRKLFVYSRVSAHIYVYNAQYETWQSSLIYRSTLSREPNVARNFR